MRPFNMGRQSQWKRTPMSRARYLFARAVRWGWLVRQPCEVCGAIRTEGHHHNYTLPYSIHWLCRRHHRIANELRTQNVSYNRSTIIEIERKRHELSSNCHELSIEAGSLRTARCKQRH
jgi:hypothetical protein